jgi:hypothetical protein
VITKVRLEHPALVPMLNPGVHAGCLLEFDEGRFGHKGAEGMEEMENASERPKSPKSRGLFPWGRAISGVISVP